MSSAIDQMYQAIFGEMPSKAGTAYERLAAIATFFLEKEGEVRHDARVRGAESKSMYQLDVHLIGADNQLIGEAKDYSLRGAKVGRDDIQKLAGALVDLDDINEAAFWSATGFTKPAQQYANSAKKITGKPIRLLGLRPSTAVDEQGFIKTICITGTINIADLQAATWTPHWTKEAVDILLSRREEGQEGIDIQETVDMLYDEFGNPCQSIVELTSKGYGHIHEDGNSYGCIPTRGMFMSVKGVLVGLLGYEYCMPYIREVRKVEIRDNSVHRLVVLDDQGNPLRILTDEKLRAFSFDGAGNLIPPVSFPRRFGD